MDAISSRTNVQCINNFLPNKSPKTLLKLCREIWNDFTAPSRRRRLVDVSQESRRQWQLPAWRNVREPVPSPSRQLVFAIQRSCFAPFIRQLSLLASARLAYVCHDRCPTFAVPSCVQRERQRKTPAQVYTFIDPKTRWSTPIECNARSTTCDVVHVGRESAIFSHLPSILMSARPDRGNFVRPWTTLVKRNPTDSSAN